jgi:hypothetical protein
MDKNNVDMIHLTLSNYEFKILKKIIGNHIYFSEQEYDLGIYNEEINLKDLTALNSKLNKIQ